jgi:catechol 2,3-dioxygenase-like lactoylglutathione lyase family enzyme
MPLHVLQQTMPKVLNHIYNHQGITSVHPIARKGRGLEGAAMIDHISIAVRDIKASARFYEALLAPLGMTPVRASAKSVGFGKTYPEFWLNERAQQKPLPEDAGAHIALRAPDTKAVDAFHAAALAAGAHSDGAPGMRHEYSPHYYAAFIRDWDGNRIEAVTFLKDAK